MAANADQAAYWNAEPGRVWVTRADDLDAMQAGVTDLLLAETAAVPGEAVLDIGCGAGATTLAFAEAVGPGRPGARRRHLGAASRPRRGAGGGGRARADRLAASPTRRPTRCRAASTRRSRASG